MTELPQSHDKTVMNEELLLMDEQRKWFLEMESTSGEDTVKTVEMTTKDLGYYMNSVDKAVVGFERIDSNVEVLLWVKCHQTAPHATEKSFMKGRVNRCGKHPCCLILRNCHSQPGLQQPSPWSVSSHQHEAGPSTGKRFATCWRLRWWLSFF